MLTAQPSPLPIRPGCPVAPGFAEGRHGRRTLPFSEVPPELNEEILACGHLGMKRFFALDHQSYEPGALDTKSKELLGLVASLALGCDDGTTW